MITETTFLLASDIGARCFIYRRENENTTDLNERPEETNVCLTFMNETENFLSRIILSSLERMLSSCECNEKGEK
jgi:hypothetical protein